MVNALTISLTTVCYATISYATIRVLTNSIVQCNIPGSIRCAVQHTSQYVLCSAAYQVVCIVQCSIFLGPGRGCAGCLLYVQYTKTLSNNFPGPAKSSRKLLYVQGLFLGYEPTR